MLFFESIIRVTVFLFVLLLDFKYIVHVQSWYNNIFWVMCIILAARLFLHQQVIALKGDFVVYRL